jgi:hypothetical protein
MGMITIITTTTTTSTMTSRLHRLQGWLVLLSLLDSYS